MKRVMTVLACACLMVIAAGSTAVTGAEEPTPPEEKVPAEDTSRVVTWAASEERTAEGRDAAPVQSNLEFVAFAAPCRFMDTRVRGGAFGPDESRDYGVGDGDLAPDFGPCGVPAHADAVSVALSVIRNSATASGSLRLGPGGVLPTAMVLQFAAKLGASTTAVVALDALSRLRLKSASPGTADYVGDLLGFYQAPIWGRIDADGTLLAGSGISYIEKSTWYLGDYFVYTDRPVWPDCAAVVTPEWSNIRIFESPGIGYYFFDARSYNSYEEADGGFAFVIQCG